MPWCPVEHWIRVVLCEWVTCVLLLCKSINCKPDSRVQWFMGLARKLFSCTTHSHKMMARVCTCGIHAEDRFDSCTVPFKTQEIFCACALTRTTQRTFPTKFLYSLSFPQVVSPCQLPLMCTHVPLLCPVASRYLCSFSVRSQL